MVGNPPQQVVICDQLIESVVEQSKKSGTQERQAPANQAKRDRLLHR
jgi:hypothetical protein